VSLQLIYRKFATKLPLVSYEFAGFSLDICCMYSCKFAACLLEICHVFALIDPDYDIDRELETNYIFKTQNCGSQIRFRQIYYNIDQ
jgi:hypothetical protein